ncbi:hypothetical protein KC332_g149 [Hortaea werneckii]|nr:hypothetical protein KC350_g10314 [Hortaea werneckii]KAI6823658.1 hypothetical protein KC342_g11950 [Hortaea werneckii]KAI6850812.1 hypothetical protein KC358_g515 [Hortaea werneckii]KAI6945136.1 hypothetical protein KC341_g333 [Hortaea werneckii]KAI6950847.1 hypothetical protein KC348_g414 [Hortaea werneckii]
MGKGAKEKELKPWSVKSGKKTSEGDKKVIKKALWVGQQPSEIKDAEQVKGVQHAAANAMELIPGATSVKFKGTEAHISTTDKEDSQKVTSFQIFASPDGTKYLGTVHAHNDGTATVRLKGQKKFKKLE